MSEREADDIRALQARYLSAAGAEKARRLNEEINRRLAAMRDNMREGMGSPTEQTGAGRNGNFGERASRRSASSTRAAPD